MRLIFLLPLLSGFTALVSVSAAPLEEKVPVPVADMTIEGQAPTNVPNVNLPLAALPAPTAVPTSLPGPDTRSLKPPTPKGVPGLPMNLPFRRSEYFNDIRPREIRNADFGISPNATFTPLTDENLKTEKEKRGLLGGSGRTAPPERNARTAAGRTNRKQRGSSHAAQFSSANSKSGGGSDSSLPGISGISDLTGSLPVGSSKAATSPGGQTKLRPEHPSAPGRGAPTPGPAPGSPYSAASSGIQAIGSGPDVVSNVINTLPLGSLPSTPLTTPDSGTVPSSGIDPPKVPGKGATDPNAITAGVPQPAAVTDSENVPSDVPDPKDGVPDPKTTVPVTEGETIPEAEDLPRETEAEVPLVENAAQNEEGKIRQRRSEAHSTFPSRLVSRNGLPLPFLDNTLKPITNSQLTGISPSKPSFRKRHSLVLSTDPLVPPQPDEDGLLPADRDPRTGLLNIDSNEKPVAVPETAKAPIRQPELPAAAGEKKTQVEGVHKSAPGSTKNTKTRRGFAGPITLDSSGLKYKHI